MPYFNLTDSLNLISKFTIRRTWNAYKVWLSYQLSKIAGKPIQWGYPISISFEPTTSCNLRCPECPSGLREFTRPTGMLQKSFFEQTIDDIHKELLYLIFYFQGEPYLNPDFLNMVKYAHDKGIYTATSTNAHYLTDEKAKATVESGLDRLIISIDGTTQDVYQSYRVGGKLEKVLENWKLAGIPSSYILQSMTANAAELLGLEKTRGVLEKSYYADIIAVKNNPLDNIDAIKSVRFVMKEGKVIRRD